MSQALTPPTELLSYYQLKLLTKAPLSFQPTKSSIYYIFTSTTLSNLTILCFIFAFLGYTL